MLTVLIIVGILLLLLLLLLAPARVKAEGILTIHSSRIVVTFFLLTFIPVTLHFRLNLFEHPYFTFQWLRKNAKDKTMPITGGRGKKKHELGPFFHDSKFEVTFVAGIKEDPALTVWALGALYALANAASQVLNIDCKVGAKAIFDKNIFRIKILGMTRVKLTNIISIVKKERG